MSSAYKRAQIEPPKPNISCSNHVAKCDIDKNAHLNLIPTINLLMSSVNNGYGGNKGVIRGVTYITSGLNLGSCGPSVKVQP